VTHLLALITHDILQVHGLATTLMALLTAVIATVLTTRSATVAVVVAFTTAATIVARYGCGGVRFHALLEVVAGMCEGTLWTQVAEAGEIAGTELATDVCVLAGGTLGAESALIPDTLLDFRFRSHVKEHTLLIVTTDTVITEELALGHFGHVVNV